MFINGLGLITSSGFTVNDNFIKMQKGLCSISDIKRLDTDGLITNKAAQISLDDDELLGMVEQNHNLKSQKNLPLERSELLMMIAFNEALKDAQISEDSLSCLNVAVLIGTSLSGFTKLEKSYRNYYEKKTLISTKSLLSYPLHVCADRLFYEYNLTGEKIVFSTACSASLHPFVISEELFKRGLIDISIVIGCDSLSLISLAGFSSLKSLAKNYCQPFSVGDYGISIGEGAGVMILSNKKGKYPSVLGVYGTSDAYHPTASNPTGESIKKCIEGTLKGTDINNKKVAVMSHGTGTQHNDMVEMRALKAVSVLNDCSVMATKSFIGHTLGASGVIESILLTKCLTENILLPIANFTHSRQENSLHCVTEEEKVNSEMIGIKSSFAFGGNNVSILIGYKDSLVMDTNKKHDNIVISGVGIVSPFDVYSNDDFINSLKVNNKCFKEIKHIRSFSGKHFSHYAGIVDNVKLDEMCSKLRLKNTRKMDKLSKIACVATGLALKDSELKISNENTEKISLITSSGSGQMSSVCNFYDNILHNGNSSADANVFPNTVVNAHAGYITIEYRIKGYSTVIAQGESGAYSALKFAKLLLESEKADAVIVGAVNEYSEHYHKALLDLRYVQDFETQNFLLNSNTGNILSEGAVFFVLEREQSALNRGKIPRVVLKDVDSYTVPCIPSTYSFKINPLNKLFDNFISSNGMPDYVAGDGNTNLQHKELEFESVQKFFPNIPFTSLGYNLGFMCGVVPFFNLAFFMCCDQKEFVTTLDESKNDINIKVLNCFNKRKSVLIESITSGGSAGIIFARKYEQED